MLFSEEFDLRQDLVCEDGVVLLEYYIRIPTVVAACPLGEALSAIAERTEAYLRDSLGEALRAEYRSSSDRHRRFTFRRASYRLVCEVCPPSGLSREVTLRRGARLLHAERVLWQCSERGLFAASEADPL